MLFEASGLRIFGVILMAFGVYVGLDKNGAAGASVFGTGVLCLGIAVLIEIRDELRKRPPAP